MDNDKLTEEKVKIIAQLHSMAEEIKKVGHQIKIHEDKLEAFETQIDEIEKSLSGSQAKLAELHLSTVAAKKRKYSPEESEETIENIIRQENLTASIILHIKTRHKIQASKVPAIRDVLGVVATLGKVNDDNLSRLFSEYLGLEAMLAIVCKTDEGVRALEKYDDNGSIIKSSGIHGLGPSIGRRVDGRFMVFSLDSLRPYDGDLVSQDPQKRLALLNPRLPNGETPSGFIGFAVNMIDIDTMHLSYLTSSGHGLRETLFYNLFSHLQVYKTKSDMVHAMTCISNGAVSLDGGIIKGYGVHYLGEQKDVEVRFPVTAEPTLPSDVLELEEQIKDYKLKKEFLIQNKQSEEALLSDVKNNLSIQLESYSNLVEVAKQIRQQLNLRAAA